MAHGNKLVRFTAHAGHVARERDIPLAWIERTARDPEWTEQDPRGEDVERRFRAYAEHGDRIMRAVCLETTGEIRILTAFFDRNARKPT